MRRMMILSLGVCLLGLTGADDCGFEPFARQRKDLVQFNSDSCLSCHSIPVAGGFGPRYRSSVWVQGPELPLTFVNLEAHSGGPRQPMPEGATHLSRRRPTTLFGTGLVDAVADQELLKRADPDDLDGDGISGRAAMIGGRVGRFGSQAQHALLFQFIQEAFVLEFGLAEAPLDELLSIQVMLRALPRPPQYDHEVPFPEAVEVGGQVFAELGCPSCHVPSLTTRDGQEFQPYSDFLLHDLGPLNDDGIGLGVAESSEWRTAPLWGYGERFRLLMHDGRAEILDTALRYHGGEAAASRDKYFEQTYYERLAIEAFLKTL